MYCTIMKKMQDVENKLHEINNESNIEKLLNYTQ